MIVHGGVIHSPVVINHYQTVIKESIIKRLKGLDFQVILDQKRFPYGFAFGLEYEKAIKTTTNEVFPVISQQ